MYKQTTYSLLFEPLSLSSSFEFCDPGERVESTGGITSSATSSCLVLFCFGFFLLIKAVDSVVIILIVFCDDNSEKR